MSLDIRSVNGKNVVCGIGDYTRADIVIPSEDRDGKPVEGINDDAFKDCDSITRVVIPSSVKFIGKSAFEGCSSLSSVAIIGSGLETIGKRVFRNCVALNDMSLPDSVRGVGDRAFEGCSGLASTPWDMIGGGPESMGEFVFHNCTGLTEAHLPGGIKGIGEGGFCGCVSLGTVMFGGNVSGPIGASAFRGCAALKGIGVPRGVTKIGACAFDGCVSLEDVDLVGATDLKSIGDNAFRNCLKLKEIAIPGGVKKRIGDGAFECCRSLRKVTFEGTGLKSIGGSAFHGCAALKGIEVPDSVNEIGDRAFEGCSGLRGTLCLGRQAYTNNLHIGNFAFRDCTGLTKIDISGKSTEIGAGAFEGCGSLKTVSGERCDVTCIGYRAFCGCRRLNRFVVCSGIRFMGDEAFDGCNALAEAHRPKCGPDRWYPMRTGKKLYDRIGIPGEVEKFMWVYGIDELSRYHAYDHVHERFRRYSEERRKGASSESLGFLFDELRLPHYLHTFLSCWGMLRGSSFLLYKDYKFLRGVCEIVCDKRFDWLMDVDPFTFDDAVREQKYKQYIHDILEIRDEITYYFEDQKSFYKPGSAEMPIDSVTDTLISKILLATLGCIPAYDGYVKDALRGLGVKNRTITGEGLGDLLWFVTTYAEKEDSTGEDRGFGYFKDKYEDEREKAYDGPGYPVMKYVDMVLWGYGYLIDGKDDDER